MATSTGSSISLRPPRPVTTWRSDRTLKVGTLGTHKRSAWPSEGRPVLPRLHLARSTATRRSTRSPRATGAT